MAARYCKVCKGSLSVSDQRMKRTTHYHCAPPPVLRESEFCDCEGLEPGIPGTICSWCGKEIRETSMV